MEMLTNSPSYNAYFFTSGDSTPNSRVPYQPWDSSPFQNAEPQIGTYFPNVFAFEALSRVGCPNGVTNEHLLPSCFKETKTPVAAAIHSVSCQPHIKKQCKRSRSPPAKNLWEEEVEHMLSGTLMDIFKDVKEHAYFDVPPSVMDQLRQNHVADDCKVTSVSIPSATGIENKVFHSSFSTQSPPCSASISGASSDNSALSKVTFPPSDVFQPDQFMNLLHDKSNMMEYTANNLEAWFLKPVEDPFSSSITLHNQMKDEILMSCINRDDTGGEDASDYNNREAVHCQMAWGHHDEKGQHNRITVLGYEGDKVQEHHDVDFEKAKISNKNSTASGRKRLGLSDPILGSYYHSPTNDNGLLPTYTTAGNNENKPFAKDMVGRKIHSVYERPCSMCAREGSNVSHNPNEGNPGVPAGNSELMELNPTLACEQVGERFENGYAEGGLTHLITAGAEAVSRRDMDLASVILVRLKDMVSHSRSTMQRVTGYFIEGLERQVEGFNHTLPGNIKSQGDILAAFQILHEIFPYIKFGHFTANQAILEAVQSERRVHIVDFEIMEGIQWPAFMQALVSQKGCPPELHITALCRPHWQHELALVQKTGKRLSEFACALNLPFRFSLLKTNTQEVIDPNSLKLNEGEALVVNCMVHLPHMPRRSVPSIGSFLQEMQKLSPKILTLVEEELGCSTNSAASYFSEAVHHFHAICESLEACLPTEVDARMLVERVFIAPRIERAIVLWSGAISLCWQAETEASSNYNRWSTLVHATGFRTVPLSSHNQSQARLLLGLHRDGFSLEERIHSIVLGWQSRPVFSASVWK